MEFIADCSLGLILIFGIGTALVAAGEAVRDWARKRNRS